MVMDSTATILGSPGKPASPASSCASPLPFSALSPIPTFSGGASRKYSMEEIWRDINLSSLHHSSTAASATVSSPSLLQVSSAGGGVAPILSLKTRTDSDQIDCIQRSCDSSTIKAAVVVPSSLTLSPINELCYTSTLDLSIMPKKRIPIPESDGGARDHRNKRMMKNRESAARSRARKQAYTTELELEVSRLIEENGMLRRQLKKLTSAAAEPTQCTKKQALQRTLTAPF